MKSEHEWIESFLELARDPEKLREALRQIKIEEQWCAHCTEPVHPTYKFCPSCGKENEAFSPEIFSQIMGGTIQETVADECDKSHPHSGSEEEKEAHSGYCSFCGRFLGKAE